MERANRYGDQGELIDDPKAQTTYFAGPYSDGRMNVIRGSIEEVRRNWNRYDRVPEVVERFVEEVDVSGWSVTADQLLEPIVRSFKQNREWADRQAEGSPRHDFPMIREYTTDRGYRTLFAAMNARYRGDLGATRHHSFVPLTWLVELLNMELFAATWANPNLTGSQLVYRGTVFPPALRERYEVFETEIPLSERGISIPLGFHSATAAKEIARQFLKLNFPQGAGEGHFGVIWNIHVASLDEERLALYHHHFPDSVVTSICATDISALSAARSEGEVLLRGPFFEVLSFRPSDSNEGIPTFELHALMVDANRDHISTFELGERDAEARSFFRKLVSLEKYRACSALSRDLERPRLARCYSDAAEKAEREVAQSHARLCAIGAA